MQKALIIVAVVGGYSLLETALLLSAMLPVYRHTGLSPSSYQAVVFLGQFLLIPGLAALLSRIMHGRDGWRRRTLTVVAVGLFGPILIGLFLAVSDALAGVLPVTGGSSIAGLVALLLLVAAGIAAGLFFIISRSARQSTQLEATKWLAERQPRPTACERRWRNRGIRWATGVPSIIVLLVFLFLPETWGLLSQLTQPRAGSLPGYRVPIPATWIVGNRDEWADGSSLVVGWASRGVRVSVTSYLHCDLPLSAWDIGTVQYSQSAEVVDRNWMTKDDKVIGRRSFAVGSETVTCVDYWPSYRTPAKHIDDSPIAYIKCSGSGRLSASFRGEKSHVPTFYGMLEGTVQTK